MITITHFGPLWNVVIYLPPPPEDSWFQWWYILVLVATWAAGTGVAAKLAFNWDRLGEWDTPLPLLWPLGILYWVPNRLTRRWLLWRDYRKNCRLTKKAK